MTRNVVSTWLVEWSLVAIVGNTMPPRDPNHGDEDDDDEGEDDENPGVRQLNKSAIGFRAGKYTVRRWQQVGT